jgi:hypothetical protein
MIIHSNPAYSRFLEQVDRKIWRHHLQNVENMSNEGVLISVRNRASSGRLGGSAMDRDMDREGS